MAGSLNKVMLIGNLGADPEIRSTNDGKRVANLRIATTERWKDKASGERNERTEWHKVAVFSSTLVDIIEKYLKKGMRVYVEGQLQTRKWMDQENKERFSTEIVISGYSGQITMLSPVGNSQGQAVSLGSSGLGEDSISHIIEDDIPF